MYEKFPRTPDVLTGPSPIDRYMSKKNYFKDLQPLREISPGVFEGEWTTGLTQEDTTETYEQSISTAVADISMKTDVGGLRSKYTLNEDSLVLVAQPQRLVLGIIDGAGGSGKYGSSVRAGRLASRVVDGALIKSLREHTPDLARAVNQEVIEQYKEFEGYATGVIVDIVVRNKKISVRMDYAGDSKAMTLRNHRRFARGTTRFQNCAQEDVDKGYVSPHTYYNHSRLNVITGGFGVAENMAEKEPIGTVTFDGKDGDIIVVASDGFWDNVSEYEVEQLSAQHPSSESLRQALYALAYERNNARNSFVIQHDEQTRVTKYLSSGDNITVAVVVLKEVDPSRLPEKINPNAVLRLPDNPDKQAVFKTMLEEVNSKIKSLKKSSSPNTSFDLKCRRAVLNVLFEQQKLSKTVSLDVAFTRMDSSLSEAEKKIPTIDRRATFTDIWHKIATMCS
jgi:serine/threonine protein phosphatase PrpC